MLSIVSYLRDDLKYLEGYAQVICKHHAILQASLMSQQVKNLPASAGDKRYEFDPWAGKIPWRRKRQPTPDLVWKIPWIEEPGRLQSMGRQSQTQLSTHMHT